MHTPPVRLTLLKVTASELRCRFCCEADNATDDVCEAAVVVVGAVTVTVVDLDCDDEVTIDGDGGSATIVRCSRLVFDDEETDDAFD